MGQTGAHSLHPRIIGLGRTSILRDIEALALISSRRMRRAGVAEPGVGVGGTQMMTSSGQLQLPLLVARHPSETSLASTCSVTEGHSAGGSIRQSESTIENHHGSPSFACRGGLLLATV